MAVRTTQSRNKAIENDRRSFAFLIQFFKYIDPDHKYSPLQAFQLTSATIDAHVTRNDLTSAIEKTQQLRRPEQIKCLQHFMIRMTALRGANHGCSWSSRNRLRFLKRKKNVAKAHDVHSQQPHEKNWTACSTSTRYTRFPTDCPS